MSSTSPLMPERPAAAYLCISHRTLQGRRVRGDGPPYVKLGARVLYRKTDLDDWIESKIRRSTSDTGKAA